MDMPVKKELSVLLPRGIESRRNPVTLSAKAGFFFQHFCENSSAKKTQNLLFGQKLKPIFVQKLKLGAAFLDIRKNLTQGQDFNILPKNYTSSKYVLNS